MTTTTAATTPPASTSSSASSTTTTTAATTPPTSTSNTASTTTLASESCMSCSTCAAVPGNTHAATDDHCAPCALGGQSWWPCDVEGLCHCGRDSSTASSTMTTTAATTTPNDGCMRCGACEAIPGNPHAATDAHCSPCALGAQSWWPCDVEGLCQCAGS